MSGILFPLGLTLRCFMRLLLGLNAILYPYCLNDFDANRCACGLYFKVKYLSFSVIIESLFFLLILLRSLSIR